MRVARRREWIGTGLVLLALVLSACGSADNDTIAICSSLPLRNGENARAASMERGIRMAFDQRGNQLTVGGRTYALRYISMDGVAPGGSGWSATQEQANARAAIGEHNCVAYLGTYNSGAAKISMPILNRVGMVMVSPGNTYPGLTKPGTGIGGEPWIYSPLGPEARNYCRVVPADDLQAPAAATYARDVLSLNRVYILHDREVYGQGLAEIFDREARALGMTVVGGPEGIETRTEDYSTLADRILAEEPDLVYFGGVTANNPAMVLNALRRAGYTGIFMGADGIAEAEFLSEAGSQNDTNVYATLVGLPPRELAGAGAEWYRAYQEIYGGEPDPFAAPSYEAAILVLDAIDRAGSLDRAAIRDAVKATRAFDRGILGNWSFDENCDTTDTTISMNQASEGDFQFVDVVSAAAP